MDPRGFVGSVRRVPPAATVVPMANAVLMAPSDDLRRMLDLAFELETFVALRYPTTSSRSSTTPQQSYG